MRKKIPYQDYLRKIEAEISGAIMRELAPRIKAGAYGTLSVRVSLENGAVQMIVVAPENKIRPTYLPDQ